MRVIGWIDTAGSALLSQLLFLTFSIPIVTCAPAAIALQRQLAAQLAGRPTGVRTFAVEFARAWRRCWTVGIVFAIVAVGLGVAVPFWFSVGGAGWIAGGVLCALGGLVLAFWLALLAVARDHDEAVGDLTRRAVRLLVARAGRTLLALVLMLTWLALAATLPPVLLVGAGLVPGVLVQLLVAPRAAESDAASASAPASQARRS